MRQGLKLTAASAIALALSGCITMPYADTAYVDKPGDVRVERYGTRPANLPVERVQGPQAADFWWIDQADGFADAIGNAPPDFGFAFEQATAWGWTGLSGEELLIETGGDNGQTQYYFAPDDTAPYLVRTGYYSFAFDGRMLVAAYDEQGEALPPRALGGLMREAEYWLQRGQAMKAASRNRRWDRSTADRWATTRSSAGWGYAGVGVDYGLGWSGFWRDQHYWQIEEARRREDYLYRRLNDERQRRRDAENRFDRWRRDHAGRRGPGAPPPGFAPPPHGDGGRPGWGRGDGDGDGHGGWGRDRPRRDWTNAPPRDGNSPRPPRRDWAGGGSDNGFVPPPAANPSTPPTSTPPANRPPRGDLAAPPRGDGERERGRRQMPDARVAERVWERRVEVPVPTLQPGDADDGTVAVDPTPAAPPPPARRNPRRNANGEVMLPPSQGYQGGGPDVARIDRVDVDSARQRAAEAAEVRAAQANERAMIDARRAAAEAMAQSMAERRAEAAAQSAARAADDAARAASQAAERAAAQAAQSYSPPVRVEAPPPPPPPRVDPPQPRSPINDADIRPD